VSARILATTVEELVIVKETDSEVSGEACFDTSFSQVGDRDKGVGGVIDNGDPTENWPKVGVVGAQKFTVVAEGNLKWIPGMRLEIEPCQQGWINDRDVGAAVGNAVYGLTGKGCCEGLSRG